MMASRATVGAASDSNHSETTSKPDWALKPDRPAPPRLTFPRKRSVTESDIEPAEIDTAEMMIAIRRAAGGVGAEGTDRDDFFRQVTAELGRQRVTAGIGKAIDNALRAASQRGIIVAESGLVYPDCRSIADYPRDLLKKTLLSVVGRTWTTRRDAITLAARHLGFERTGAKIKAAFKSALTGLLRPGEFEYDGNMVRRAQ